MKNNLYSLSLRTARMVELGFEKQLGRSIFHSPFRLFYNLFKKKSPQTIQNVRNMLASDIKEILGNLEGFEGSDSGGIFVENNCLTDAGKLLMKRAYNIGIRLVRKLSVKLAFKALRDKGLQEEIYGDILTEIKEKASIILKDV